MSFSIADHIGQLSWCEQDAIDRLMALGDVLGVDALGRNQDGEVVVHARHHDDEGGTDSTEVLISDEDGGARFSVDGIVYVPTTDRLALV